MISVTTATQRKTRLQQRFRLAAAGDERGELFTLHLCSYLQNLLALNCICEPLSPSCLSVPEDLSLEERDELSNIRRRKRELLDDIEVCVCACEWALHVYLQLSFISTALQLMPSLPVMRVTLLFQRLKFEIAEVMTEIEQLTCIGER